MTNKLPIDNVIRRVLREAGLEGLSEARIYEQAVQLDRHITRGAVQRSVWRLLEAKKLVMVGRREIALASFWAEKKQSAVSGQRSEEEPSVISGQSSVDEDLPPEPALRTGPSITLVDELDIDDLIPIQAVSRILFQPTTLRLRPGAPIVIVRDDHEDVGHTGIWLPRSSSDGYAMMWKHQAWWATKMTVSDVAVRVIWEGRVVLEGVTHLDLPSDAMSVRRILAALRRKAERGEGELLIVDCNGDRTARTR